MLNDIQVLQKVEDQLHSIEITEGSQSFARQCQALTDLSSQSNFQNMHMKVEQLFKDWPLLSKFDLKLFRENQNLVHQFEIEIFQLEFNPCLK